MSPSAAMLLDLDDSIAGDGTGDTGWGILRMGRVLFPLRPPPLPWGCWQDRRNVRPAPGCLSREPSCAPLPAAPTWKRPVQRDGRHILPPRREVKRTGKKTGCRNRYADNSTGL